jgi:hypothetical protein
LPQPACFCTMAAAEAGRLAVHIVASLEGILPLGGELDRDSLPKVRMPNRDGFVPDPEFDPAKLFREVRLSFIRIVALIATACLSGAHAMSADGAPFPTLPRSLPAPRCRTSGSFSMFGDGSKPRCSLGNGLLEWF